MSEWLGFDITRQDHVDGSDTTVDNLPNMHRVSGKPYPFRQWHNHHEEIRKYFLSPRPQANIVEKFKFTTGVMQNPLNIYEAGENFVLIRGRQGFTKIYGTMAPQYMTFGDKLCPKSQNLNLNEYTATRILLNGMKEGEIKFAEQNSNKKIKTHLIFAIGREVSSEESVRLVKVALMFDKDDVPAIDFVCDEATYPLERHAKAIYLAQSEGRDVHAHAGEWVNKDDEEPNFERDLPKLLENIKTAVRLGCKTINHARALAYSKPLMKVVVELGIGISSCPGNYLASGYIKDIRELRLDEQLEAGVKVFLDHDDSIMFPLLNDVGHMCLDSGLTRDQLKQMNQNAWDTRPGQ